MKNVGLILSTLPILSRVRTGSVFIVQTSPSLELASLVIIQKHIPSILHVQINAKVIDTLLYYLSHVTFTYNLCGNVNTLPGEDHTWF